MRTIVVDVARCLHCGSCELACALSHSGEGSLVEALGTRPLRRIRLRPYGVTFAPIACRHCEDAPCVHACISGARVRTADGVECEDSLCVACGTCYMVCPIGAINRHAASGRYASCDRCGDGEPHCVEACPTGALRLVEEAPGRGAYFELRESSSEAER